MGQSEEKDRRLDSTSGFNVSNAFKINLTIIILVGIVMVYSSSFIYAKEVMGTSAYFLARQLVYCVGGIVLAYVVAHTRLSFWYNHSYKIYGCIVLLILLSLIPGIGLSMKGSHRWLRLGGFTLQPGEFLKYGVVLASMFYFENFSKYTTKQRLLFAGLLFFPLALVLKQPDFGTFSICLGVIAYVGFMGPFPRKWFWSGLIAGSAMAIALVFAAPYRVKRILVFLDPWQDPLKSGFQIIQSYLAFANGGVVGQGIGNSNEKLFYLPEAYNDFIFSVIGEELGLIGVVVLVLLFVGLVYWGLRLAHGSSQRKVAIVMAAIVVVIGLQAFLNMGVVLGLLPTKGLNLPFVSYGGSSLLANFFGIGLLYSAKNKGNLPDEKAV